MKESKNNKKVATNTKSKQSNSNYCLNFIQEAYTRFNDLFDSSYENSNELANIVNDMNLSNGKYYNFVDNFAHDELIEKYQSLQGKLNNDSSIVVEAVNFILDETEKCKNEISIKKVLTFYFILLTFLRKSGYYEYPRIVKIERNDISFKPNGTEKHEYSLLDECAAFIEDKINKLVNNNKKQTLMWLKNAKIRSENVSYWYTGYTGSGNTTKDDYEKILNDALLLTGFEIDNNKLKQSKNSDDAISNSYREIISSYCATFADYSEKFNLNVNNGDEKYNLYLDRAINCAQKLYKINEDIRSDTQKQQVNFNDINDSKQIPYHYLYLKTDPVAKYYSTIARIYVLNCNFVDARQNIEYAVQYVDHSCKDDKSYITFVRNQIFTKLNMYEVENQKKQYDEKIQSLDEKITEERKRYAKISSIVVSAISFVVGSIGIVLKATNLTQLAILFCMFGCIMLLFASIFIVSASKIWKPEEHEEYKKAKWNQKLWGWFKHNLITIFFAILALVLIAAIIWFTWYIINNHDSIELTIQP